jgi:hypothetical protein
MIHPLSLEGVRGTPEKDQREDSFHSFPLTAETKMEKVERAVSFAPLRCALEYNGATRGRMRRSQTFLLSIGNCFRGGLYQVSSTEFPFQSIMHWTSGACELCPEVVARPPVQNRGGILRIPLLIVKISARNISRARDVPHSLYLFLRIGTLNRANVVCNRRTRAHPNTESNSSDESAQILHCCPDIQSC